MFIGVVIAVGVWIVPRRFTNRAHLKWVEFGIVSAFLATYDLKAYWKLRRSFIFWSIFLGVFFIYLLGLGYFFFVENGVSMLTLALAGGAEFACLACAIYWILDVSPPTRVNLDL